MDTPHHNEPLAPATFLEDALLQIVPQLRRALSRAYMRGRADQAREQTRPMTLTVVPPPQPTMLPSIVMDAVATVTGVSEFRHHEGTQYRSRQHCRERQAAAILLRDNCGLSLPAIARMLGWKDHTTVSYAIHVTSQYPLVRSIVEAAQRILDTEKRHAA
jgi:chromosomal replication initiation ATPase DnaA